MLGVRSVFVGPDDDVGAARLDGGDAEVQAATKTTSAASVAPRKHPTRRIAIMPSGG